MNNAEINATILKLADLVEAERNEELQEYSKSVADLPLTEQRKLGTCRFPLKVEEQLFNKGERLMIKLVQEGGLQGLKTANLFKSGVNVKLFVKDGDSEDYTTGVVNNSNRDYIVVTLNCDSIRDWMLGHGLVLQLMFDNVSYKEMQTAIKQFVESENEDILRLKNVLYGNLLPVFQATIPFVADSRLNDSQNDALRLINSAQDVAIVHGPPGTGKTTTLVRAVLMTLKTEKRVLVCAPSNSAVDLLAEKLSNLLVNVVRIGQPARVTDQVLESTLDARIANHSNYKDIKMLRKKADEYRRMAAKYKRNFGPEERQQRNMLYAEAKKISEEADHLAFYITSDIIANAEVICTTLVGAANKEIKDLTYSTVFIDEAAQALEPSCLIPILRAKRVVLAGDHFQLPPTVKSRDALKGGLSETLFEKVVVSKPQLAVMLTKQYRMNKAIMQFSNQIFYSNKLFADALCENKTVFESDNPFEFIDTAGTGYSEQHEQGATSILNSEEAAFVVKYLEQYMQNVDLNGACHRVHTIGIISPYKAQVEEITKYIKESQLPDYVKQITTVDTVDAFQGREKDVVIISLVRSNSKGEIGFLSDTRRMNVAMTRAKLKLVVVGDSATISRHKFYDLFVQHATNTNAYRSAFEFVF